MRRGGRDYSFRERGSAPYRRPRRFSPRGPERSLERLSYSPVRQEHHPGHYEDERSHFSPEVFNQPHSSVDQYPSGYVGSSPHPAQHPTRPQLSSNPTAAAIEAGLLLITELANNAALASEVSNSPLDSIHPSSLDDRNRPVPSLMECKFDSDREGVLHREIFLSDGGGRENQRNPGGFLRGSSDLHHDEVHPQHGHVLQSDGGSRYGIGSVQEQVGGRMNEVCVDYRHPGGLVNSLSEQILGSGSSHSVMQDRFQGSAQEERDRHGGYVESGIGDRMHPQYRQVHSSISASNVSPSSSGHDFYSDYRAKDSFERSLNFEDTLEHPLVSKVEHDSHYHSTESPFLRPLFGDSLGREARTEIGNLGVSSNRLHGEHAVTERSPIAQYGIEQPDLAYSRTESSSIHKPIQSLPCVHSDRKLLGRKRKPSGVSQSFMKKLKPDLKQHASHPRSKLSSLKKVSVQKRLGPQPLMSKAGASVNLQHDGHLQLPDLRSQLSKQIPTTDEGSRSTEQRSPGSRTDHPLPKVGKPVSSGISPLKQSSSSPSTLLQWKASENVPSKSADQQSSPAKTPSLGKSLLVSTSTSTGITPTALLPRSVSPPPVECSGSAMTEQVKDCFASSNKKLHQKDEYFTGPNGSSSSFKDGKQTDFVLPRSSAVLGVEVADLNDAKMVKQHQPIQKKAVKSVKSEAKEVVKKVNASSTSSELRNASLGSVVQPGTIKASKHKQPHQETIITSIFPLLGKGNVKLPFSLPEQEGESLPETVSDKAVSGLTERSKTSGESDSDSEGDLVIDVTREPESPIGQKYSSVLSSTSPYSDDIESFATFTFQDHTKTECEKIADEVLSIDLVNQMRKCVPNPLCILYDSIQVTLGRINRWEVSVPMVKQAFRSFALTTAVQPWTLTNLFRIELENLYHLCLNDLEKWKNNASVFSSISSSLCKQKKPAEDADEVHKHVTSPCQDKCSFGEENVSLSEKLTNHQLQTLGNSGAMDKVTSSKSEDCVGQSVTEDYDGSVGTDSNECNMSVCSTLSDGEIIDSSGMNSKEVLKREFFEEKRQEKRMVSLSPGELTPTPPSSPVMYGSVANSSIPMLQSGSLKVDIKVSGNHQNYSGMNVSLVSAIENSVVSTVPLEKDKRSGRKINEKDEKKSRVSAEPVKALQVKKSSTSQNSFSKDSKDKKDKVESRERKGSATTKPLVETSKRNAAIRSNSRRDHGMKSRVRGRLHSSDGHFGRRRSSSRGRSKLSHSPSLHSRRVSSPKPISRYKQGFSSPSRRDQRDSKRRHRSRTPEMKDAKRGGRSQQHSRKHDVEDEDIELLQLKKEVILSIVKKPEQGKSSSIKAISSTSEVCSIKSCTAKSKALPNSSNKGESVELVSQVGVSSTEAEISSGAESRSATVEISDSGKKSKTKQINSSGVIKKALPKSATKRLKSSPRSTTVESSGPNSPISSNADISSSGGTSASSLDVNVNKAMSVMVYPGKESTWKIQPFQITSSGCDSDSEVGDANMDAVDTKTVISEVSSFLVEARKVASQASNMAKLQPIQTSPTPPASLPPERKKEYIKLKKRIALHEKNLKKKKLMKDVSRTTSPQLVQPKDLEIVSPMLSSPCATTVSDGNQASERSSLLLKDFKKQLQDSRSRMEDYRIREQQEQQAITEITNELTNCVFEIERHERDMESMQNKLLNLQKKLEITGKALKGCEKNMTDLTSSVRLAKTRKLEYSEVVAECKAQVDNLEKKIQQLEQKDSVMMSPQHSFDMEPISDPEELESSEIVVQGVLSTGKFGSGQDCSNKTEVLSMLSTQSEVEVIDSKHMSSSDQVSVSKEIVRSSSGLNRGNSLLKDKPFKLHQILSVAMRNALPFPCKDCMAPLAIPTRTDRTLLSTEVNVNPLVASVLSSLTQQSFDNVLLGNKPATEKKFHGDTEEWDRHESKANTQLHACTENPFTLSRDDPPTLILPMVVEGNLNLGITEPSVSSVAMEAVNDGIVKSADGPQVFAKSKSNDVVIFTGATLPLNNHQLSSSSVHNETISTSEERILPEYDNLLNKSEKNSKTCMASSTPIPGVCQPNNTTSTGNQFLSQEGDKSTPSIESRTGSVSLDVNTRKSENEGRIVKGKSSLKEFVQNRTEPSRVDGDVVTSAEVDVSLLSVPVSNSNGMTTSCETETGSGRLPSALNGSEIMQVGAEVIQSEGIGSLQAGDISKQGLNKSENEMMLKARSKQERRTKNGSNLCITTKDSASKMILAENQPLSKSASESNICVGTGNEPVHRRSSVTNDLRIVEAGGVNIPFNATSSAQLDSEEFRSLLQMHVDCVEDMKDKLAVNRPGGKSTECCARTSGMQSTTYKAQNKGLNIVDENWTVAETLIKKIISDNQCLLPQSVGMFQDAVSNKVALYFSVHEFLFSDGIIRKPPQSTQALLPTDILNSLPCSVAADSSLASSSSGFKPYISPLLQFSSYRSSPNFSSSAKVPLSSVTYSNKLDPHKAMCQFELTGTCSNSSCTAQHFRDVQMTSQDISKDLLSYCPSLAGVTEQELSDGSKITSKLSTFADKFLRKYSGKVSNEDIWKILCHELNKERIKSTRKREIISFDCDSSLPRSEVDMSLSSHAELAHHYFCILPKVNYKKRYFNMDRTILAETDLAVSTCNTHVLSAQKLLDENNIQEALIILENGAESDNSEEVWLKYLLLKSDQTSDAELDSLYDVFTKAIESTHSYSVMLETIQLSRCFASKLRMLEFSMGVCKLFESAMEASRCCFELFINVILLHLLVGKPSVALKHFDQARRSSDEAQSSASNFSGLINVFQREECILLCLCHLNVSYSGSLPSSIFAGGSCVSVPAKLSSREFFAVSFDPSVTLPPNGYKKMLKLSKYYLDFLHDSSLPSSQAVEKILPIFRNVILFETIHGSLHKAINILHKLSLLCPHFTDLWMMLARINELEGMDGCRVLEKAVVSSPMKPELYYLAARLELSRCKSTEESERCVGSCCTAGCLGHSHHISKAVEWLSRCVKLFYSISEPDTSVTQVLTLYRKLLNQMIGFNQTVPPFAEGIDSHNLKEQLCPLWLCYCLLVELAVVPSMSNTGEKLFHQSAEEAYESAIHALQSPEDHKAMWKEYIFYMKEKSIDGGCDDFLRLVDCVQRCLMDVDVTIPRSDNEGSSKTQDYSFHNEMLDVITSRLPSSSVFKCEMLQKLACKFPENVNLITQLVQCALQQQPPNTSLAQTVLAEVLALQAQSPELWKQAIEVEIQLGHTKEARWMFNKALEVLPLQIQLWRDCIVFELKELLADSSSNIADTNIEQVFSVIRGAKKFGIDLLPILQELSSVSQGT